VFFVNRSFVRLKSRPLSLPTLLRLLARFIQLREVSLLLMLLLLSLPLLPLRLPLPNLSISKQ
jgi:hypothetical protein